MEGGRGPPRRLIWMRHAKSDWGAGAPSDHARPLAPRGARAAPRVAEALRAAGWWPAAVVVSDATRARQTWAAMAPVGPRAPLVVQPELYHAGLPEARRAAMAWPEGPGPLLVIGHNPGWEAALEVWGLGVPRLPTGAAALLLGAGASWAAALDGPWTLHRLLLPRALEGEAP